MENWTELIKAVVRPFIVIWAAMLYGICIIYGIAVPDLLAMLVTAVIIEYFGERALIRFKQSSGGGDTKGEA
jgi:hypothetical protein